MHIIQSTRSSACTRSYNRMQDSLVYLMQKPTLEVRPVKVLSDVEKAEIQVSRDQAAKRALKHEQFNKRVPIFDRRQLNTIGQMVAVRQMIDSNRFSTFGNTVAAELQKAGL
jgi:hypothetical protein